MENPTPTHGVRCEGGGGCLHVHSECKQADIVSTVKLGVCGKKTSSFPSKKKIQVHIRGIIKCMAMPGHIGQSEA